MTKLHEDICIDFDVFVSTFSGTTDVMLGVPCCEANNEEKKMAKLYNDGNYEIKNHLLTRLRHEAEMKTTGLEKDFGLRDDDAPTTPKGLVDRIMAGKYVLPEKADDEFRYDCFCLSDIVGSIRWRDPAVKEDHEGFKAAQVLLDKAKADVEDLIMVGTPDLGLKAFQDFRAQTFH